jgi:peptide/nickel transport system substrate-binding protein
MKKLIQFWFSIFLMVNVLGAVWAGGNQQRQSSRPKDEIIVSVPAEPIHFIPAEKMQSSDTDHIFLYNVYDTLLYKDTSDGSVKPWLAERWELSPDGRQIRFKLRENVYFHDGSKLTAHDVQFTYDNTKNFPVGAALLINYDRTEVIDDYNFIIHMTAPYNAILNSFCARAAFVISKAYYEKVGEEGYKAKPIGTGAYKFVRWISGDSIVLEANNQYWRGAPTFKKFTIKTIPDVNTQILALETGDVDIVLNAPIENLQYLNNPNLAWDAVGSNASHFLAFFMHEKSWVSKDLNFRKAVQTAIDKDAINTAVFGGKAEIIDIYGSRNFTTRPLPGTYSAYTRDMAKAREYLAKSNYNGQELNIACIAGTANQKSAEIIQGTLAELGINVKITATDSATFFNTTQKTGDYDAMLVIHNSSVMDEDSLYLYFAKVRYEIPGITYLHGDEMNDLVVQARQSPDNELRRANYAKVSSYVNDDAYTIYILMDVNTIAYRKDLKGVRPDMAKYYRAIEWSY